MLLPNFINNDVFTSILSKLVVDDGSWDKHKKKHIEEYEDNVEDIVSLCVLNGWSLIIRIVIISPECVDLHNHEGKVIEITLVFIISSRLTIVLWINIARIVIDHY